MAERRPCGPLALLDRRAQSLGCAMCGECCEQIVLAFDPRAEPTRDRHPENAELYRDYWRVEWADDNYRYPGYDQPSHTTWMVTCEAYDAERRACTHPNRPPICRDYPWYERHPSRDRTVDRKVLSDGVTACSYALDAPGWSGRGLRPLIPVTVLQTRPAAADGPHDDSSDQADDGDHPQGVRGEADPAEQQREDEQDDEQSEHGDLQVAAW